MKSLIVPIVIVIVLVGFAFTGGAFTGLYQSQGSVDTALELAEAAGTRAQVAETAAAQATLREHNAHETAKNLNISTRRMLMNEQKQPAPDKRNTSAKPKRDKRSARKKVRLGPDSTVPVSVY